MVFLIRIVRNLSVLFIITQQLAGKPLDSRERYFNSEKFADGDLLEVTNYLGQIARLAEKKFFGSSANITIEPHFADQNTLVSISVHQPGIFLPVARFLFEGDILLRPDQAKEILEHLQNSLGDDPENSLSVRVKRKFYTKEGIRWKWFPIKYKIAKSLRDEPNTASLVHEAIDEWQRNTCLTFQWVTDTVEGDDYLEFFKGQGCYSMIGRIGGQQGVSIGTGCERVGVIIHEVGHALGLWHEQARPDADRFITINADNVIRGTLGNFLEQYCNHPRSTEQHKKIGEHPI